jgi:hypothetical protein
MSHKRGESAIPDTKVKSPTPFTKIDLTSPTSNGGGLIAVMNKKNELIAEQNKLLSQKNEIAQMSLSLKADIANQTLEIAIGKSKDIVDSLYLQANSMVSNTKNLVDTISLGTKIKEAVMSKVVSEISKKTGISVEHFKKKETHMDSKNEHLVKKNEHLDHAKNGSENLKNSDGEKIIPRDAQALHNSEKGIETSNMNSTDFVKQASNMIDSINSTGDSNEEDSIDFDIMSKVVHMMVEDIDATKIDNNIGEQHA